MAVIKWSSAAIALLCLTAAATTNAEEPLVDARHHAPTFKREAEERYPMESETALLASSCRPEKDGFFGGTSSRHGSPVLFDYVFQMESVESADLKKALVVIYDRVIDSILSESFPSICSAQGRRLQEKADGMPSHITGFKFNVPQMDLNDQCDPILDPKNNCAYFKGKVQVFGRNVVSDDTVPELMQLALDTVEETKTIVSNLGVVRLLPSSKMSTSNNGTIPEYGGDGMVEDESGYTMTPIAKASFAVASFTMILGVICLVVWVKNDLKRHRNVKILDTKVSGNGLLHYFTPNGTFPDDTSGSTLDAIYLQDDYNRGYQDILSSESDLDYVFEDSSQAEPRLHAFDHEMNPRATYT